MTRTHALALFTLFAAGQLPAQTRRQEEATRRLGNDALRVPIHGPGTTHDADYGVWAAGADFKASFHDGFAFYPLLGDSYPENLPFVWRTVAVTAGGEPMAISAHPKQEATDWRLTLDHGAWREVYEVRAEGVEQMFVFDQRPVTGGDLVLRGAVGGRLQAQPAARGHQALIFADADLVPHVRYGAAFAIDARGDKVAADTSYDGQCITLTVDGTWLAHAKFPVTVDPLTAAVLVNQSATLGSVGSTDVCSDNSTVAGRALVVAFTRNYSATDHDIYVVYCNADFSSPTTIYSDTSIATSEDNASVAFVPGPNRWVVAFAHGYQLSGNPSSTIRVYVHDRGNFVNGSGTLLSLLQLSPSFLRNPDIGGGFPTAPGPNNLAMLTYTQDPTTANDNNTIVWARPINAVTPAFMGAYEVGAANAGSTYDREAPSVSQSSNGDGWIIAYSELNRTLTTISDIAATRISATGTEIGSTRLSHVANRSETNPQVTMFAGEGMVSFHVAADANGDSELRVRSFNWPVFSVSPTLRVEATITGGSLLLGPVSNQGLAMDLLTRSGWLMTYTRTRIIGLNVRTSAYTIRLGGGAVPIETSTLFTATTTADAIAPSATYDYALRERFAVVYATNETNDPLYGRQWDYPADAGEFRYGTACGTAIIDGSRPYIGNYNYGLHYSSGPANSIGILFLGVGPAAIPLDGAGMTGCAFNLNPGFLVSLVATASPQGNAAVLVPLSFDTPPLPADLYFQWLYTSPGANPAGLQATQGLRSQVR